MIYLYIFISFSMWVLQNIFTVIIENAYIDSKYNSKFDWLRDLDEQQQEQEEP